MAPSTISRVELREFSFEVKNLGISGNPADDRVGGGGTPGGAVEYAPGHSASMTRYAVVIETADGCRGDVAAECAFCKAGEDPAGPHFHKSNCAVALHGAQALCPADRSGQLLDQSSTDLFWIRGRLGRDICLRLSAADRSDSVAAV